MPTLKLTNLATYRSYFQEIATLHKEIDGFKCGDEDVIRNDNRSDMPERFLWLQPYDRARYNDSFSDNITKAKVARLAYFIIAESEKFADEDAAFDFCEAVIEQIVAKLLKDKRGEVVDGEYTMIATQVNNFAGGPVEKKLGSTKYIGWELEATFLDNANLQYDATKWESPEPEPELLDLKFNFGPSGMSDVEGWTSVPFGGTNPDNLEPLPWNNTSNDRLQVTNWAQAFTIGATDPLKRTHWQAASNWNAGFKITGLNPEKQYTVRLLGAVADDDPESDDGTVSIGPDFPEAAYLTDSNVYDEQSYYLNRTGEMFTDADGPDGATEIVWETVSPNADGELYVVMGRGFNSPGGTFFPVVSYLRITENP